MDESFTKIFPGKVAKFFGDLFQSDTLQEVRIKVNKPCILITSNKERISDFILTDEDIKYMLKRISNYSLYAYEEDIRQGFITIKGGHRVGLAGECVMECGKVKTIRNISSLNFRICREVLGCSKKVMKYIYSNGEVYNTIIISPPKCGKTTMLRDIAKNLSEQGKKITIIDERSEIAGSYLGVPQMNLGIRCDVLDNCLKSQGMIMAIRSLSPEVLICDEIGTSEDVDALCMAFNSGVRIIVTIHGFDIEDITKRKIFKELISNNLLDRAIVLTNEGGVGTIKNVYSILKEENNKCLKLY